MDSDENHTVDSDENHSVYSEELHCRFSLLFIIPLRPCIYMLQLSCRNLYQRHW